MNIRIVFLVLAVMLYAGELWGQPTFSTDIDITRTYGDALFTHTISPNTYNGMVAYTEPATLPAGITNFTDNGDNTCSFDIDPKIIGAPGSSFTFDASDDDDKIPVTFNLTVNKATLTATAQNASRIYGVANPTFTINYTGFVYSENETSITAPTASCIATSSSNVGTYTIELSGGAADNYTIISLVDGTLTVDPAPITNATITVPAPATAVSPTTTVTGSTNFTGSVTWSPYDNPFKGSTQYTASITLTAAANYTFPATGLTVTLNGTSETATVTNGGTDGNTATLSRTFPATAAKTVNIITIKTQPKLNYTHGNSLDLSGLVVTLTYNDGTSADVKFEDFGSNGITTDIAHGSTLSYSTHNGKSVLVTCNGRNTNTNPLSISKAPITSAAIMVTAPVTGAAPNATASGTGNFTIGSVSWTPGHNPFQVSATYTATVTLTATNDYTFTGLTTATINGYTATVQSNNGTTATLKYEFVATAPISISSAAITVTAPITGAMQNPTATSGTVNFTYGSVTWSPNDNPFQSGKQYTASITLKAAANYTFPTGLTGTVNGISASVANPNPGIAGNTATLSRTFTATGAKTLTGISIKTQPTLSYTHGNALNLSGLVVTRTYNDLTTDDVPFASFGTNGITTDIASGSTLSFTTHNGKLITVTCNGFSAYTNALSISKAVINSAAITVTAPVTGAAPNSTASASGTVNFTIGQVSWTPNPNPNPFQSSTQYTAVVTLSAASDYTFTGGVTTATINGYTAAVTNNTGAAVTLSYQFAATTLTPITSAAISVTAPETRNNQIVTATGTGNFDIGQVSWTDNDNPFKGNKQYTATVTLTAHSGYTFTGMTGATINGHTATRSNNTGSAVTLSYAFPATDKLTQNLTINNPGTKIYGDNPFTLTTTGSSGTGTITFTLVSGPGTVSSSGLVTITGAGNINVSATIAADDYYMAATSPQLTINVGKAPVPNFDWPKATPVPYSPDMLLSAVTFSPTSITLGDFSWTNGSIQLTAGTANRSMTLTLTQSAKDNYNFVGATVTGIVSVTVNKATPVVTLNSLPTMVYGDNPLSIDDLAFVFEAPELPVKFRLATGSSDAVDVSVAGIVTVNHAGNSTIEAYVDESANYTTASRSRNITVEQANLYVIPEDYLLQQGKTPPIIFPVRYEGFINGDDESVFKGELYFKTEATSDPLMYDIIASGVSAVNYQMHFLKGRLFIVPKPTINVWVENTTRQYGDPNQFIIKYDGFEPGDNESKLKERPVATCNATPLSLPGTTYRIRLSGGSDDKYAINILDLNSRLTIEKAVLTVTAENKKRLEGDPNPDLDFTYSGFKNGEDESIFLPKELPTIYTYADTESPPGPWVITFKEGEDNDRYEFKFVQGILTILPKRIVKTYGDQPFEIPITSGVPFTIDDVEVNDESILDCHIDEEGVLIASIKKSGTTNVTFYVSTPPITIMVEVKKAVLVAKVRDCEREQGKINPEFTIDYSGFVYNENENDLLSLPRAGCDADPHDIPKDYVIWIEGGEAENYIVELRSGILKVVPNKALPTAFTPNDDLVNDVWPWKESNYEVSIFNRLGVLLYTGKNGWDGRYKGNYVQPGVYFYIAAKDGVVFRGTVEVIRTK